MRYLTDVVEKLEVILLPVANDENLDFDKPLIIAILKFLSSVLKNAVHKRYFLIVEVREGTRVLRVVLFINLHVDFHFLKLSVDWIVVPNNIFSYIST